MWPTFALLSPCVVPQIHRRNWKTTLSATVQTQDSWKPCQTVAVWVCFSGKQHSDKSTAGGLGFWRDYKRAGWCSNEEMYNFECVNVCSLWEIPLARFSSWLSKWIRGCVLHFLFHSVYINASLSPAVGSQSDTSEAVWSWKTAASGKSCCIWSAWVQLQTLSYQKVFLAKADSCVDRLSWSSGSEVFGVKEFYVR